MFRKSKKAVSKIAIVFSMLAASSTAHGVEYDMVGISYTPVIPVPMQSDTSIREIKNGGVLHEQDFMPAKWVAPTQKIVLIDAFTDIKRKGTIDFTIEAHTPYFEVVSKNTSEKSFCTNVVTSLLKWKKKTRSFRTCLVDVDNDGAFDKVYVNNPRINAIHNVGGFLMRNGTPIKSVRYRPASPDPKTIVTCQVMTFKGLLSKSDIKLVFIDKERPKLSVFEVIQNEVIGRFRDYPTKVNLKGFELEILNISKGTIKYRVLNPFPDDFIYNLESTIL